MADAVIVGAPITYFECGTATAPTRQLPQVTAEPQMAVGISRAFLAGRPVVALSIFNGATVCTATFDPEAVLDFRQMLDAAELWQHEQLRLASGQAVQ